MDVNPVFESDMTSGLERLRVDLHVRAHEDAHGDRHENHAGHAIGADMRLETHVQLELRSTSTWSFMVEPCCTANRLLYIDRNNNCY